MPNKKRYFNHFISGYNRPIVDAVYEFTGEFVRQVKEVNSDRSGAYYESDYGEGFRSYIFGMRK